MTIGLTASAPATAAAIPEVKPVANNHQAAVAAALRVASAWAWAWYLISSRRFWIWV